MRIKLRTVVTVLVTVALFSALANLVAGRWGRGHVDPVLEGMVLQEGQQAQVQEALFQVRGRARQRDLEFRQRLEALLTPGERAARDEPGRPPERGPGHPPGPPPPPPPPPPEPGPPPPPPPPPPERPPAPPPHPGALSGFELSPARAAQVELLRQQQQLELQEDLEQALAEVEPPLTATQKAELIERALREPRGRHGQ